MIIRTEHEPAQRTAFLLGRFDAHETAEFRRAVEPLLGDPTIPLRIDLSQVAFVDSTALAELVKLHKAARARGSEIILVSPSDPVRVILEITDLTDVFHIEPPIRPGEEE